tara:strand:- start:22 stop:252 length:231 start_codon:yes stop_codon:yes gene_type:complete
MTRFDFTQKERLLLNKAVSCGLVDAVELAVLVANYGNNVDAIKRKLSYACWVLRNGCEEEKQTRSMWIEACKNFRA